MQIYGILLNIRGISVENQRISEKIGENQRISGNFVKFSHKNVMVFPNFLGKSLVVPIIFRNFADAKNDFPQRRLIMVS